MPNKKHFMANQGKSDEQCVHSTSKLSAECMSNPPKLLQLRPCALRHFLELPWGGHDESSECTLLCNPQTCVLNSFPEKSSR